MTAARSAFSVSILALVAFGLSLPAQAAANRINGVRVSTAGESTVVEIAGERAPNFTTFKQDSPRRVIVDVAECNLGTVPDRIQGDGQLVSAVTTAQYGQSPHGISRVIIGLSSAAEYKVTTRGGSLYVHLTPGAGGLLVSAGVPIAPNRRSRTAPAGKGADLDLPLEVSPPVVADAEHAPTPAAAEPDEAPAEPEALVAAAPVAEPAPEPVAEPAPEPVAEPASELADEPAPPEPEAVPAEPVRVAMASPPPAEIPQEPAPAVADPSPTLVAQDEEEVEEVEEVDDEVPVAPTDGLDEEVEPPPPPPPADEYEVEPPPPPPPSDDDVVDDIPPPPDSAGDDSFPPDDDTSAFEDIPPPDDGIEDMPPPPPVDRLPEDVPVAPGYSDGGDWIEVGGALKDMTWVGFQQTLESSRVFIKTTEPVRFHVTEEGENLVVLELENTRIPLRNNTRFLDTHFFDSSVTMITPREIEGVSRNVRIEIQLRNKVPFSSGQDENMVFLDFQRP